MEENKKSGGWDVRASKSPSEMAYHGQLHASEAEAQLGARAAGAVSLGEGRSWQESIGRAMPPLIHTMPYCLR